jgi:DNA-binding transcriptional regulator YiaG
MQTMTAAEFKAALEHLGFNQSSLARRLQVSDRNVRRWAAGEYPVPAPIALLLQLMIKTKTSADGLSGLTKGEVNA